MTRVAAVTRVPVNGSMSLVVVPPKPCGLVACVAELEIAARHGDTTRVHLNDAQRRSLIEGLGGRPAYDAELADRLEHNGGR